MDLSAPQDQSVDDRIDKELCSFHYTLITKAATQLLTMGKGAKLAKMDIKQAYRNIPTAPEDRHLLGIQWKDLVFT